MQDIPIHIPLWYKEANLCTLYDKFLAALSSQKKKLVSSRFVFSSSASALWMLKVFTSTSFAVLTRKMNFFIALHRSELQKGTMACMEVKSTSNIYVLLSSSIGWGTATKNNKTVSPMEMYRHVIISLMKPMTLSDLLWTESKYIGHSFFFLLR